MQESHGNLWLITLINKRRVVVRKSPVIEECSSVLKLKELDPTLVFNI